MALQFFNTADLKLDTASTLFIGEPGVGKTKIMGEALSEYGKDAFVVDFPKEKGLLTIKTAALDGALIETYADWKQFLTEIVSGRLKGKRALGIDGLPRFYRDIVMPKLFPNSTPAATDYTKIHNLFEDEIVLVKRHVPTLFVTAGVDRSMDQVRQELFVTPDLPGRMAVGVAYLFDFVFFMEHEVVGTTAQYRLYTVPKGRTVTKARTPYPLPPVITLPTDKPAWPTVKSEIEAALDGKPGPMAIAAKPKAPVK